MAATAKRKRSTVSPAERIMGVQGLVAGSGFATDFFQNLAARSGFGAPALSQSVDYPLVRLSYQYTLLYSLFRNHWISRKIVEIPAQDMCKAWPRLTSDIEPKDLTRVDRAIRRTNTKNNVLQAMTWARLFGGAGALMVIDGQEDQLEEPLDLDAVGIGAYKGLAPFDMWSGIRPAGDLCTDINRPLDFNKPEYYEVNTQGGAAFKVHSSRILRFLGPTVPAPEYAAQMYWGISVLEPAYESITALDSCNANILNLTFRAQLLSMEFPALDQILSGMGSTQGASRAALQRWENFNQLVSNQSFIPTAKDGELKALNYSFGGLGEIFQLFQLDLSGASGIPVTRLWGRTFSGLGGSSNEGDERVYEEKIAADQAAGMTPQMEQLYPVIMMSELGEVPDDLDLICPSIRSLDEKDKAELAKAVADTVTVYLNGGIMSPRTAAKEVKQSSDFTGIGTNITDEDLEALSDKVQAEGELGGGLFGEEGAGLSEASSPAKAIKSENKAGKETEEDDEPLRDLDSEDDEDSLEHVPLTKAADTEGKRRASDADGPSTKHEGMSLYHGLPVRVETPAGGRRSGKTPDGKPWSVNMPADYGFVEGTTGADGDSLDCYVGPSPESSNVYVVDQLTLDGKSFDEHKCLLGFYTLESALEDYHAGHHLSNKVFGAVTEMTMPMFRKLLVTGDLTKPLSWRSR